MRRMFPLLIPAAAWILFATQAHANIIGTGSPTTTSDPPFQDSTIAIYDSDGNLLASQTLDFSVSGLNTGIVLGFTQSTADIGSFTLTDNYIGIANLTVNGVLESMPLSEAFGPGPAAFDSGITWSSTNATTQGGAVFGYDEGYGFGTSSWSGNAPMAGLNDSSAVYGVTDTMTFKFTSPVSSVYGCVDMTGSGNNPVDSNCSVDTASAVGPHSAVPEPSTLGLLSLAVVGLGLGQLHRKRAIRRQ